ncbi:hypothetical protein U27_05923 [Candidatus Vecturithrix granuli]|uniref:Uncharacterized protein n=1 Tax=Vecturithrix granuli TaxID=1499967 RepID=A0A081C2Z3_VECG1|nr:hypothetical protein U27_05923 [Candidatus Vecturithrix granuli]
MSPPYFLKDGICWKRIEIVMLGVGFVGTATACLANYSWHWFKESLFFMIWSALPYGFLLVGNHIACRVVKSRLLQPVTALIAVALTALSLMAYIRAVLSPNHSSGMVFFILPLCWMIAIPVVLTGTVIGFLMAARWRKSSQFK